MISISWLVGEYNTTTCLEKGDEDVGLRKSQQDQSQKGGDPAIDDGRTHTLQTVDRAFFFGAWNEERNIGQ